MVPEPGLNPTQPSAPYPSGPVPPDAGGHPWPSGFQPGPNQVFWPAVPVRPSALPVDEREYHEFFRAPRFRWWKPLLSLGMFTAVWFIGTMILTLMAGFYDLSTGRTTPGDYTVENLKLTPALFTANNLALALAIPLAGLTAWAVFGQRPKWISSVAGGFRWRLFWKFALVALVLGVVNLGVTVLVQGTGELRWNADSAFLIVAILLTTPLQAAGEEYGVRGILARSIGSWFGYRRVGLVVSAVITSLVFMALHGADNIWLNSFYFLDGLICSVLVWKTGGLEAAVAQHVLNNLIAEATLPFSALDNMFERGPDAAGPESLIPIGFTVVIMFALLWVARRERPVTAAAPGAPVVRHPAG